MQISLDILEEDIVEIGERSLAAHVPVLRPRDRLHPLQDVCLLLRQEEIRHFTGVQDHADVLEEGLVLDLHVIQ